jgi:hypothetical protein
MTTPMRATPSASIVGNLSLRGGGLANQNLSSLGSLTYNQYGTVLFCLPTTSGSSLTSATVYVLCNQSPNPSGYTLSAEL